MRIRVQRVSKTAFAAHARSHLVLSDQPAANGGSDTSMTPPELFLSSLGTCIGYYVAQYFDTLELSCEELEIEVSGEIVHSPGRVGNIRVALKLPAGLEKRRQDAVLRAASGCTLSNTLKYAQGIQIRVDTVPAALPA